MSSAPTIFISAAEASGDHHTAGLIRAGDGDVYVAGGSDGTIPMRSNVHWPSPKTSIPRESATRVIWRLQVPAKGEATLSYRVRITRR